MKKSFYFLVLGLFVFTARASQACSCLPFGDDFFETVSMHNQKIENGEWTSAMALNIVVAEVTSYTTPIQPSTSPDAVITVLGSLQGNSHAKQLTVKGGDGASCEMPAEVFKLGKKYVFALMQSEAGEYFVSLCGNYYREMASPYTKKKQVQDEAI